MIANLHKMYELLRKEEEPAFSQAFPYIDMLSKRLQLEPLGSPEEGCYLGLDTQRYTPVFANLGGLEYFCQVVVSAILIGDANPAEQLKELLRK